MINSGELFGIILFYKAKGIPDFAGGSIGVYSLYLKTRAKIAPANGRQALENGQRQDIKTVLFTMRWRRDLVITTGLLIVYDNLPYEIYSLVDTGNKRKQFEVLARAKEGLVNITLDTGLVMQFKSQFKTKFG